MPPHLIELCGSPLAPPVEYIRWTFNRYRIPYRFTPAAAIFSMIHSRKAGVSPELPLLIIDGVPSGGFRPACSRIFGELQDGPLGAAVPPDPAFAERLTEGLMTPAARVYYAHMLPHPRFMKIPATAYVPLWQRLMIMGAYPIWAAVLSKFLTLKRYDADEPEILRAMDALFADTARRLDGRPFLGGDRPGQEDLLFASLASPVLLPPGHPVRLPPMERFPEGLQEIVRRYRATEAGRLALRTYERRNEAAG